MQSYPTPDIERASALLTGIKNEHIQFFTAQREFTLQVFLFSSKEKQLKVSHFLCDRALQ